MSNADFSIQTYNTWLRSKTIGLRVKGRELTSSDTWGFSSKFVSSDLTTGVMCLLSVPFRNF